MKETEKTILAQQEAEKSAKAKSSGSGSYSINEDRNWTYVE